MKDAQADTSGWFSGPGHKSIKTQKVRKERRKAKKNPETPPGYRKFRGYES